MKSRLPSPGQRLSQTALEGEVLIDTLVIGDNHLNKLRIKSNIEDVGQSQSELCCMMSCLLVSTGSLPRNSSLGRLGAPRCGGLGLKLGPYTLYRGRTARAVENNSCRKI